jgi:low molecular weight phosphotyrosine protein phosphatase
LILGFDKDNIRNLERIKPKNSKAEIKLVNFFNEHAKNREIGDPYYEDTIAVFEQVYKDCHDSCIGILNTYR